MGCNGVRDVEGKFISVEKSLRYTIAPDVNRISVTAGRILLSNTLHIEIGVKTDPVEYRYSYPWLFRLLAEEGILHVQIGTFFELYSLPDVFFTELRRQADEYGLSITSMFTAHRELGGFFREEPGWEAVARKHYERLIEVGGLLGVRSVGSNPGALLRDRMCHKDAGTARYLKHMRELMHVAHGRGISCLTMEPMSCLAEPPSLPDEITAMAEALSAYHADHPGTAGIGYCADISHGYVDRHGAVVHTHLELLKASLPWLRELHLKNTDARYHSTFGFTANDLERGIIDLAEVRDLLFAHEGMPPGNNLVAYLEIGGPKLGRDYGDPLLEEDLRESLRYIKAVFSRGSSTPSVPAAPECVILANETTKPVEIAPSLMCADFCRLEDAVKELDRLGADWLHLDIMDGRFTPNMPIGFEVLRQLRPITTLPFDAHLMVMDHEFFVRELLKIGVEQISVHVESGRHLDRTLAAIRDAGVRAGVALNPGTPLQALEYVLERLDFVLIMTVNPGFAGQQMVPAGLRKIKDCHHYLASRGVDIPIQVDGHVSFLNIPDMVAAGADCLVAGSSSLFHAGGTRSENMAEMKTAIRAGLARRHAPEGGR